MLALVSGTLALSGCSMEEIKRGWMPGKPGITDHTDMILNLWTGTWITAWIVGGVTWALMIWCMVAYRRRKGETGFPVQLRYHLPIEIMYTVLPIMAVGVLFYFTARDMAIITAVDEEKTDVNIQVIGKRWAWDFNYLDSGVYDTSEQVAMNVPGTPEQPEIPTLYLPVDQTVTLKLDSRDVIHSFWVPEFLYKEDMIPGKTDQYYQFTPHVEGTYQGKCAELCGEYHSEMIFQVKVVSQQEYDAKMAELREAGQTGALELELGREDDGGNSAATEGEG
jgi:cytochrome c oxidase subunit 2